MEKNDEENELEPTEESNNSQETDEGGDTNNNSDSSSDSSEQGKVFYENLGSESLSTVIASKNIQTVDQDREGIDQDELERAIDKELEEGVKVIAKYLEEESEFIKAYQEMVGKERAIDEVRELKGEGRKMTDEEWEKEVKIATYNAELIYESMEKTEIKPINEEIPENKEDLEIEKEIEPSEEISEPQLSDLKEDVQEQEKEIEQIYEGREPPLEQHQVEPFIKEALETVPEPITNEKEAEKLQELDIEEQFETVHLNEFVDELVEKEELEAEQLKEQVEKEELEAQTSKIKEANSELYEVVEIERDGLDQHEVEATIAEALETEPEPIINEKEVEKLQELDIEEQFEMAHLNEFVDELVEKEELDAEQLKEQVEKEALEAQTSKIKEANSELYEVVEVERDELDQHEVEATIEEELKAEPEPIINEKEVEKLQKLDIEEQFEMAHLNEYVDELVERQDEDKNIENDKIKQEKENIEQTKDVIHQSTYLQKKLEEQELELKYEEKDIVEQHQVEAAIEEELKTEPKPSVNEEELEYIKVLEPEKQLEAEVFYEFIEELANKQIEEKEEHEENEEQEEISTEQKVVQIMRELEIPKEINSDETEVESISQEGKKEQETTTPDGKMVEQREIEEYKDHQQELEEILEQNRKIEQEALKEIELGEEDLDKTIEKNYERAKNLYKQQTGKRPIYANKETKGFKQWLEQKKNSEEKEKTKQKKELKEEQKKEETWKWFLKNWIEIATEINPELKSELKKLVEEYDELEKLIKKYSQLYNKAQRELLSQAEKSELKSLIKALQKIDPIKIELFLGIREIKRYLDRQHFFDFWDKTRVNQIRSHFFTHLSQKYKSLKQAQNKKENSEEVLRNWIEQASEEEISPELKVKLKEIVEDYSELEELATRFMELYGKAQREHLSKPEKHELKSLMLTLQKLELGKIELFSNIRAIKNYINDQHLDDFSDKTSVNQILNRFFTHLSQKYKKLNKIPKSHQDIETSKEKRKKCRRCHNLLSYNKFEKYGSERGKKEGKQSYRTLCKNCRRKVKSISALRKKLRLILELNGGKCNNCHTGLIFLPSFEFHHTEKEIKNLSWRKISQNTYQTLKNWAVNEKVTPLCGNCHSKEQAKYYKEFQNLILTKNLFKLSQEEIEELINVSIRNHPKFKNSKIKSKIKYQIKRWIRKRFVIEQLYNGKCIVCGLQADENLTSMIFHHRNEKQKTLVWGDLRDLDCVEILKSLISENCICICLNCHGVLHSTFNSNIEEILKSIFTENEINKFSSDVNLILSRINNAIISFKFKLETIKFISPLKYAIDQNNIWKIKMLKIFSYLEQSEFRTKDIMSLCNNNYSNAYEIISKLVEKEFLLRVKREGFTQNYYKFSEEGIKKVKEFQQTYDLHEDLKSLENEQIYSIQRMENDDILEIYPKIIKSIIKTKGYNEFTVKELAEAIGKSTVNISRILRIKLIPNGYVKVKNSNIITKKYGSTKVYYLTEKTEIL